MAWSTVAVAFVLTAAVSITSKAIRVTFRIGYKPR
jgi:hypothetical protein